MAEALYRKYRPKIFEDVVGQEHIQRTIKNAIEQDKVSHAYLFTGPRGTGKTTTARLLAKALLCQKGPTAEPDGTCEDCEMIARGEHPDVYELDAASRTGVENVREEIIGRVQFAPTRGRYKVYIIDEVHMLSTAAFNALLKTLEEPPSHVVFVLATTDPQKVPETIHSRCQRFDFRRISSDSIVSRLGAICVAEGVEFEGEALELVAHRAEGGMRNALTSLEQLIAFGEGKVTMEVAERMLGSLDSSELAEIVRFVGMRDVAACFRWTAEFVETGADLAQFTRDFAEHVRNMYVMSLAGVDVALDVSESARRELAEELKMFGSDRLARLLGVLGDLSSELKTSTNPRLSFEIALTRMVRPESELTLESLAERVERLEGSTLMAGSSPECSVAQTVLSSHETSTGRFGSCGTRFVSTQGNSPSESRGSSAVLSNGESVGAVASSSAALSSEGTSAPLADPMNDLGDKNGTNGDAVRRGPAASSASAVASATTELSNPAALQRLWQSVMAQLKKAKAAYGVLFMNTKAVFNEAQGTLVIEFPAENDFAFRAVQKPDVQDELARCILQACGTTIPHSFTRAGGGFVRAGASVGSTGEASSRSDSPGSHETSTGRFGSCGTRFVEATPAEPCVTNGLCDKNVANGDTAGWSEVKPKELRDLGSKRRRVERNPVVSAEGVPVASARAEQKNPVVSAEDVSVKQALETRESSNYAYDEVPLDAYDSYGYADGYVEEPPATFVVPVVQQQPAIRQEPVPTTPVMAAATAATPSMPATTATTEQKTLSDLDDILAFGFGEGVSFREMA